MQTTCQISSNINDHINSINYPKNSKNISWSARSVFRRTLCCVWQCVFLGAKCCRPSENQEFCCCDMTVDCQWVNWKVPQRISGFGLWCCFSWRPGSETWKFLSVEMDKNQDDVGSWSLVKMLSPLQVKWGVSLTREFISSYFILFLCLMLSSLSSPKFLNPGHHPITDFTFGTVGRCGNHSLGARVFSEPNPPVWPQAVHIFAPEAGPLDPLAISLVTGSMMFYDSMVHDLLWSGFSRFFKTTRKLRILHDFAVCPRNLASHLPFRVTCSILQPARMQRIGIWPQRSLHFWRISTMCRGAHTGGTVLGYGHRSCQFLSSSKPHTHRPW